MFQVLVSNQEQRELSEALEGSVELGRGPQRDLKRCLIDDLGVSRDQLRVDELSESRVAIENLSGHVPLLLADGNVVSPGQRAELDLPVRLTVGNTLVELSPQPKRDSQHAGLATVGAPHAVGRDTPSLPETFETDETPSAETLARWFETMISVQRAAASTSEFYEQTARAVVDLVGLDCGLVLLRRDGDWEIYAQTETEQQTEAPFSRQILRYVVDEQRTFYQDVDQMANSASLMNVTTAVASPIFGTEDEGVVGAVYGARFQRPGSPPVKIRPLEAQLVQALAAAVGAGLARLHQEAEAARRRVLFEQFFSPKLSAELDRNPELLQGRDQVVTVLFADIRGFTELSARLGPSQTCRFVGDVMECLTGHVMDQDGVVVDYYGDGLMAMWNAPVDQPNHCRLACQAAVKILGDLPRLSQQWESLVGGPLKLGVGINTGQALVGNTGSLRKFKYGPLGLAVNQAQRLESATKHLDVPVLISETTHAALGESFATRRLCKAHLKGIPAPVDLYELKAESADADWMQMRDTYEQALSAFEQAQWSDASQLLKSLADRGDVFDEPCRNLLHRVRQCLEFPPSHFDPAAWW